MDWKERNLSLELCPRTTSVDNAEFAQDNPVATIA
jgi:hypothetical protein